jgi:hypothetical protein
MAESKSKSATPEQQSVDDSIAALEGTSSDAAHSTYARADQQREGEINPPPGPQTQQVRGKPSEGGGTTFTANRARR